MQSHGARILPSTHIYIYYIDTLPETNISPENGWLEYYFPFGMAYFQGRTVSFREGIPWELTYPTWGRWENHRLKSTFQRGYVSSQEGIYHGNPRFLHFWVSYNF